MALKMEQDPRALHEFCDELGSKHPPPAHLGAHKPRDSMERNNIPSVVIEENMEVPPHPEVVNKEAR